MHDDATPHVSSNGVHDMRLCKGRQWVEARTQKCLPRVEILQLFDQLPMLCYNNNLEQLSAVNMLGSL